MPRHRTRHEAEMDAIVAQLEELVARRAVSTRPRHSGRRLGSLLVTRGYLVQAELDFALQQHTLTRRRLGEVVVELGFVSEDTVVELLAEQLRIEVLVIDRIVPEPAVGRMLAESEARRLGAIPLRERDGRFSVAVVDPTQPHLVAELTQLLHAPVRLFATTRDIFEELMQCAYTLDPSSAPR